MIILGGYYRKGMTMEEYWKTLSDTETYAMSDAFFNIIEGNNKKPENFTYRAWLHLNNMIDDELKVQTERNQLL